VGDFVKEIWPFILALLFALLVVTYFPALIMFFPNMM
jgi:TRAP-type C4-dicarboxylate transport system permease large subunit